MLNQLLQNLGLAAENIDWKDPAHFFRHDDGTCYLAVCGVFILLFSSQG